MNPFLSIKARLLTFALCISLIPITVITTTYYLHARGILRYGILEHVKAVAESRAHRVLSLIERMNVRIVDFSTDGVIRRGFEKIVRGGNSNQDAIIRLNGYLSKNKLPLYRNLVAIVLADKHGKIVSSTHEKLIGQDISGQDVFVQGISKKFRESFIGQPQYFPDFGTDCIGNSAPIISKQGTGAIGVIVNIYRLAALYEITTDSAGMGKTGEVYLVNKDKLMLTESRFVKNAPRKQAVDTKPVRKILEDREEMVGIYPSYRSVPVVGASIFLPEYGWMLLAEIDKKEAFASLKALVVVALIIGVVGAAAVTGVAITFAVSTTRPIKYLTSATERFTSGDFECRMEVTRKDEIGSLARSYNIMAEELSRVIIKDKRMMEALKVEIEGRKRVEEDLRKLFNAVEQSSCSVVITDTKGSIEYVNPKFCRVTGYVPAEVIGQNPRILKSGEQPSEEYKCLWDTITAGGEWQGEFHNKKKNGEFYWEYVSISPVRNDEGVITHFVAIKEDITEHKRVEDELREQRNQLESLTSQLTASNKELEAFCYSVSHDLRAPLRSINGFSKALMENCSDRLDSQDKNHLHRVMAASKYMGQLIDDLLNLSRITRSAMHWKRCDMSAITETIAAKLKESEPERQVEFVIAKGLLVDGDPDLMRIALENLLSNAWKFTGKRPRAKVEFGVTEDNGKPVYFVRDNGAGFDMNFVNKLFGAFQRLHSITEFEGTGIGLATVQRIIHRHGGQIWAEGAVDKGATFHFTM